MEKLLVPLMWLSLTEYCEEDLIKFHKVFEADSRTLELMNAQQKRAAEAKKPTIARKTVRPLAEGSIAIHTRADTTNMAETGKSGPGGDPYMGQQLTREQLI